MPHSYPPPGCFVPTYKNPELFFYAKNTFAAARFIDLCLALVPGKNMCPFCFGRGADYTDHELAECPHFGGLPDFNFGEGVCLSCGVHIMAATSDYSTDGPVSMHPLGSFNDRCRFMDAALPALCGVFEWDAMTEIINSVRNVLDLGGKAGKPQTQLTWIRRGYDDQHWMNPIVHILEMLVRERGMPWTFPPSVYVPAMDNRAGVFISSDHNSVESFEMTCKFLRRGKGKCACCWAAGRPYDCHEFEDCQWKATIHHFQFGPDVCSGCGVHLHQGIQRDVDWQTVRYVRLHDAGARDDRCRWKNTSLVAISAALSSREILEEMSFLADTYLPVKVSDVAYYTEWIEGKDNSTYHWLNPVMLAMKAIVRRRECP